MWEWYNLHHHAKLLELKIDQGFIMQNLMIVVIIHILPH